LTSSETFAGMYHLATNVTKADRHKKQTSVWNCKK